MRAPAELDVAVDGAVETDGLRIMKGGAIMVGGREIKQEARACLEVVRSASGAGSRVRQGIETTVVKIIRQRRREISYILVGC